MILVVSAVGFLIASFWNPWCLIGFVVLILAGAYCSRDVLGPDRGTGPRRQMRQ